MAFATQNQLSQPATILSDNSDVIMAVMVVCILLIMVVPLQPIVLDILLSFSVTFGLVILLIAMYVTRPLDLSSFPTILLIATLFRLSLNIASTRLILLHGHEGMGAAGQVIQSFGSFVVGGNYLVGIIIFAILVLVNFMVITKGAGRIAEVAARFTLDAMPGKQMAIDADLHAGAIDDLEANERRSELAREAEYYGAMDGANKFVRGDATAGIIITLINIIGGLAIGVFQNSMSFGDAARTYTILTVGDGLVSQIPALLISTATGVIVSRRAGSESGLGKEITSQLFMQPRAIGIAGGVLFLLGMIPGLPTVPFFILALFSGGVAFSLFQLEKEQPQKELQAKAESKARALPEPIQTFLPDLLALEIGYGLIPLVDAEQKGDLLDRIRASRQQISQEIGIIVPSVHIMDNMQLKPGEYAILLKGNTVARGELQIGHLLAMNSGNAPGKLDGIATKEPTYGLPAWWIREENREKAQSQGYTVVDLSAVLTTHLSEIIRRHAHEYIGRQEVQQLLDNLRDTHPKVIEELIPNLLPLGGVVKVLQNLLMEQIPIRDLPSILETLADWAPLTRDLDVLTEYTRQALSRTITRLYQTPEGGIPVITLDPGVEKAVTGALQQTKQGVYLALEPDTAQQLMSSLAQKLEKFTQLNLPPVVLCSAQIRSHLKKLTDRFIPNLVVLSYNDVLSTVKIQSLGTVGLSDAN